MRIAFMAMLLALMTGKVCAQGPPSAAANISDQASNARVDEVKDTPEAQPAAASAEGEQLKAPPGFKIKKRGDKALYCRKGSEIGTRFVTETCYDEAQMRQYLLAREQNKTDFEQGRAICATGSVCTIN